jgi:GTP cyclohydrolase I
MAKRTSKSVKPRTAKRAKASRSTRAAMTTMTTTPPLSSSDSPSKHRVMPDVQGSQDTRNVAIDRVGVKDVTYPLRLKVAPAEREHWPSGEQATIAKINMYVALSHYQKGTHMSRFMEVLNAHEGGAITPQDIPEITGAIRRRLNAAEAHFSASFTYFLKKFAPVTRQSGLMDYQVTFDCTSTENPKGGADVVDFILSVRAPATSLCPCSKEISRYGAHNQRCVIEARVRTSSVMWIEELIRLLEGAASAELFAVLKRPDEKHVTEAAYDNPKFVEDIVRDLALSLQRDPRVAWYAISSENFESIHSHNAYAEITRRVR